MMVEDRDVDAVSYFAPIRDVERDVEIVVEDCTAQPRHRKGPFMASLTEGNAMVARRERARKQSAASK